MFHKSNTICGLDIGTSFVRAIIGKVDKNNEIQVVGFAEAPSRGVRRGMVIDIQDTATAIKSAVNEAENMADEDFNNAYTIISGPNIFVKPSRGTVIVSKTDGEISKDDINRVLQNARVVSVTPNREIIYVIPQDFLVDSEKNIIDPVGMYGLKLEVNALVIEVFTPFIKNLTKAVNLAGVNIGELVVDSLCGSLSALSKQERNLGVLLLDIGSGTSDFVVYEEEKVIHLNTLPLSSAHITNDLALGLKKDINIAEQLKINYGNCCLENVSKRDLVDLSKIFEGESGTVSKKEITEIVEARVRELFSHLNKELKRINKQRLLPAGAVLVGNGSKLPGLVEIAKEELNMPARLGLPLAVNLHELKDPAYASIVGILHWVAETNNIFENTSNTNSLSSKFVNWFKKFLP